MIASLLISTRNRAGSLRQCLDAIKKIDCAFQWELIIIDNGSTDGTPAVLSNFAACSCLNVRYLREPRRGQARALNRGIAVASGKILIFTDDDCYVAPDFLQHMHDVMKARALDYAVGRVELFDPADAALTIKTDPEPYDIAPNTALKLGSVHGCNMAVRRTVIEKIGLFDTLLGVGAWLRSGADHDLLQRASLAGLSGGYVSGAIVYHAHGRRGSAVTRVMKRYDVGRGAILAKLFLRDPHVASQVLESEHHPIRTIYWLFHSDFWLAWRMSAGFVGYLIANMFRNCADEIKRRPRPVSCR